MTASRRPQTETYKGRPGPSRIGQARGETDAVDETLGIERGFNLSCALAAPSLVAIIFELLRDQRSGPCGHPDILFGFGSG
jgi:hypothetical protein